MRKKTVKKNLLSTFNWIKYFGDFHFSISIKRAAWNAQFFFLKYLDPLYLETKKYYKVVTTEGVVFFQLREL